MPVFDRLRYRRDDRHVFLYAFETCCSWTAGICAASR
jgi:hypothetical protein